jgi:hypothetical protein
MAAIADEENWMNAVLPGLALTEEDLKNLRKEHTCVSKLKHFDLWSPLEKSLKSGNAARMMMILLRMRQHNVQYDPSPRLIEFLSRTERHAYNATNVKLNNASDGHQSTELYLLAYTQTVQWLEKRTPSAKGQGKTCGSGAALAALGALFRMWREDDQQMAFTANCWSYYYESDAENPRAQELFAAALDTRDTTVYDARLEAYRKTHIDDNCVCTHCMDDRDQAMWGHLSSTRDSYAIEVEESDRLYALHTGRAAEALAAAEKARKTVARFEAALKALEESREARENEIVVLEQQKK